ncbi:winged helix-turn-helix domain-containing protein [Butyricicoccus pullicaecorum]|nr:winged helix-turn-helix domain-containing protein [Butyricicoccus pullicaecorum]
MYLKFRWKNLQDATVHRDECTLPLTATERTILQRLTDARGHIVTYDALCQAVWGSGYYGYENSLNVHIRHLREKIEADPSKPVWLQTVRGIGYRLRKEASQ